MMLPREPIIILQNREDELVVRRLEGASRFTHSAGPTMSAMARPMVQKERSLSR